MFVRSALRHLAHVASVFIVVGCDRSRVEKHEPAPPVPSAAVADGGARSDSSCDTPFPQSRLAELARDPKAVEPWGRKHIDEANRVVTEEPSRGEPGDPARIAAAWNLPLPVAYADFIRRFDGANVRGVGRIEIWNTSLAVEIAQEGDRPVPTRAGRFISVGTDGGSRELMIDLDNWSGRGRCAVMFVSQGAPDFVEFIAPGFAAAIDRVLRGPELEFGEDRIRPDR